MWMTLWAWLAIGVAASVVVSTIATFVIAKILGHVGLELTDVLEQEAWARTPLTRELRGGAAGRDSEGEQLTERQATRTPNA